MPTFRRQRKFDRSPADAGAKAPPPTISASLCPPSDRASDPGPGGRLVLHRSLGRWAGAVAAEGAKGPPWGRPGGRGREGACRAREGWLGRSFREAEGERALARGREPCVRCARSGRAWPEPVPAWVGALVGRGAWGGGPRAGPVHGGREGPGGVALWRAEGGRGARILGLRRRAPAPVGPSLAPAPGRPLPRRASASPAAPSDLRAPRPGPAAPPSLRDRPRCRWVEEQALGDAEEVRLARRLPRHKPVVRVRRAPRVVEEPQRRAPVEPPVLRRSRRAGRRGVGRGAGRAPWRAGRGQARADCRGRRLAVRAVPRA